MQGFFFGNNRIVDDSEFYGSAGFNIGVSGQDWLGLGAIVGGASKGTEMCGSKPLFAGKARNAWIECNKQSLSLQGKQLTVQEQLEKQKLAEQAKRDLDKNKQTTQVVVISLVLLAIVVTTIFLFRKRKATI